tara:strand:+ start:219 stop:632 length:414 start_codon:yes stop_codon:yes gene_type:complete
MSDIINNLKNFDFDKYNCLTTDWGLIDIMNISEDIHDLLEPDNKPKKKDYGKDLNYFYNDSMSYFKEWKKNIEEYFKLINKFFIVGREHYILVNSVRKEWNEVHTEIIKKLRKREELCNKYYKDFERKNLKLMKEKY